MSPIHLTDNSFKKEVLESDLPVLVDFWATWCVDPQSIISINDRESASADAIKKGSYILGYNGNGIKRYKVINSETSRVLGHCKKIVTDTGREIKVTDEHRFYTLEGWKKADELRIGDKVAVDPSGEFIRHKHPKKILISEKDIRKYSFKSMIIDRHIEELENKGLLPLRLDNPNLLILARLIGAQFSDGSLYHSGYNNYREVSFSVGQIGDVGALRHDLNNLGFECMYRKKVSKCNIKGRIFVMRSYTVRSRSTSLWLLLRALGAPAGNKTNTVYKIPEWIMRTAPDIQREFLAAYLGGDGPTVNIRLKERQGKEPYNSLSINDIEFHKRSDLEKSGLILASQISRLLTKFGVKINKVFIEDDAYERKDKSRAKIIHIQISNNFGSAYNLCQRIGYAYARQKSLSAKFIGEFLKKRLFERQLCSQKYKEAILLSRKKKMSIKEIALQLGLSPDTVFGWIRYNKKPAIFKHFEKYPAWLKEARERLRDGMLWEKTKRIEPVYLDKVQALITEKEHNFIANGFLVHNCGPCRLITPIIEELAKEYENRLKIGKLNVDENPKTTSHYGIMSIPTLLFFKNGKITEQVVGALNKVELKRKIEENL